MVVGATVREQDGVKRLEADMNGGFGGGHGDGSSGDYLAAQAEQFMLGGQGVWRRYGAGRSWDEPGAKWDQGVKVT